MQQDDGILLDDSAYERILQATDGAAAPCFQCGVCTATCPWGLVRDEPVNVRKIMRRAQLGLDGSNEMLWLCTTCGACEARCPRGVDVTKVMLGLRSLAWANGGVPEGLPSLMWDIYFDGNPWGQPPSRRFAWAQGLDLKDYSPDDEILYYVGCTAAYDRRMQRTARAVVTLLRAAGVAFGVLGDREPCCGDTAHSVGQAQFARQMIDDNVRLFAEAGVKKVITISPHCYDVFKSEYPQAGATFEVLHYTEYLAQLVEEGRLRLEKEQPVRVTYHDPCYLGRKNGVYDAPRAVLQGIPGLELVEMAQSREDALCCGGGGGRMWLETEAGQRFGDLRVAQAQQAGADLLVTACPYCVACLEDGLKGAAGTAMRVMDVAEVALMGLSDRTEGAAVAAAEGGRSVS